jgi:hypothetical protein
MGDFSDMIQLLVFDTAAAGFQVEISTMELGARQRAN